MVVTDAIAMPLESPGARLAALTISGNTDPIPAPRTASPAIPPATPPAAEPAGKPGRRHEAADAHDRRRAEAIHQAVAHEPHRGPGGRERHEARARQAARGACRVVQVHRAPVERGALHQRHAEAQRAQCQQRPRRTREGRHPRPARRLVREQAARGGHADHGDRRSRGEQVRARRRPRRRCERPVRGPRQGAEAVSGVQRGHDRAAQSLLDLGTVHVHRHVERSRGRAHDTRVPARA